MQIILGIASISDCFCFTIDFFCNYKAFLIVQNIRKLRKTHVRKLCVLQCYQKPRLLLIVPDPDVDSAAYQEVSNLLDLRLGIVIGE